MSDSPTRAELERALRRAHLDTEELRGQFLELAAHVLALTGALDEAGMVTESKIGEQRETLTAELRQQDERTDGRRVQLSDGFVDKYALGALDIPCDELLPLCEARCCTLRFSLSPQDLDEGVARWDYGDPYRNLRRKDGYCVHNDPSTRGCGIYEHRPAPCRRFDCRNDERIWADYDARIPSSAEERARAIALDTGDPIDDAEERAAKRRAALTAEALALRASTHDD